MGWPRPLLPSGVVHLGKGGRIQDFGEIPARKHGGVSGAHGERRRCRNDEVVCLCWSILLNPYNRAQPQTPQVWAGLLAVGWAPQWGSVR
jgi:hypothetical protein